MTSSKVPPAASIAALRFSNTCWAWARKSSLPTTLPEGNLTGNQDDGPASYSCDLRVANRLRRGIRNEQLKIDLTGHRFSRSFVGLFSLPPTKAPLAHDLTLQRGGRILLIDSAHIG